MWKSPATMSQLIWANHSYTRSLTRNTCLLDWKFFHLRSVSIQFKYFEIFMRLPQVRLTFTSRWPRLAIKTKQNQLCLDEICKHWVYANCHMAKTIYFHNILLIPTSFNISPHIYCTSKHLNIIHVTSY